MTGFLAPIAENTIHRHREHAEITAKSVSVRSMSMTHSRETEKVVAKER